MRKGADAVAESWWSKRRTLYIGNTEDPEIYRYGVHGKEFWANLTVGPGKYDVTLKFADTPVSDLSELFPDETRIPVIMDVYINGEKVIADMDLRKEAGGKFKAVDRTFKGITPRNGIIEIRFKAADKAMAVVQAIEIQGED